jgi:hypothetical protein
MVTNCVDVQLIPKGDRQVVSLIITLKKCVEVNVELLVKQFAYTAWFRDNDTIKDVKKLIEANMLEPAKVMAMYQPGHYAKDRTSVSEFTEKNGFIMVRPKKTKAQADGTNYSRLIQESIISLHEKIDRLSQDNQSLQKRLTRIETNFTIRNFRDELKKLIVKEVEAFLRTEHPEEYAMLGSEYSNVKLHKSCETPQNFKFKVFDSLFPEWQDLYINNTQIKDIKACLDDKKLIKIINKQTNAYAHDNHVVISDCDDLMPPVRDLVNMYNKVLHE